MTDPQTTDLDERLRTLNDSVVRTEGEVREQRIAYEHKLTAANKATAAAQRAVRLVGALAIAGIVVYSLLILFVRNEANRRQEQFAVAAVVNCENANVTRAAIVEHVDERIGQSWQALGRILLGSDATPEQRAEMDVTIAALEAELSMTPTPTALGPRDCSPEAVSSPTTITGR